MQPHFIPPASKTPFEAVHIFTPANTRLSYCLIYIFRIFRIMQGSFCFLSHKVTVCGIQKFFFSYAKMRILRKTQIKQQTTSHPFLCSGVKITDKTCQITPQLYHSSRCTMQAASYHFPPNGEKDKRCGFFIRGKRQKRGVVPIVGIELTRCALI